MDILILLIVLALLILVHEFGHFIAAKRAGVRVDEFGLGFPPRLFGVRKGETEYTVNLIPFGGFVKIFGEDPDEASLRGPDKERSLSNQPKRTRALIIAAGVLFNFLFAWALFSVEFMFGFPMSVHDAPAGSTIIKQELLITGVSDGSPASRAGLQAGDSIASLRAADEILSEISVSGVRGFISSHGGEEITLSYMRKEVASEAILVPARGVVGDEPAIGIAMDMLGFAKLPVHRAVWEGGKTTVLLSAAVVSSFAGLIADAFDGTADFSQIAGPVGIVGFVEDATLLGPAFLLGFVAFISVNLAVLNLVPFPALDGGRLFFLLIEAVKGSPIRPAIANAAHAVGFGVLILLMLAVTYNDVVRLFAN